MAVALLTLAPGPALSESAAATEKIAFTRALADHGSSIVVMRPDGGAQTTLTPGDYFDLAPAWSPDRTKIAFARSGAIVVMNTDGSNQTTIPLPMSSGDPTWSPDGRKLAFSAYVTTGDVEIYTMNPDGSELTDLTNYYGYDYSPDWSPDGSKIAFTSFRIGRRIVVMNADGSGQTTLSDGPSDLHPAWSPDGQRIAFHREEEGVGSDIYVMSANGSGETNITNSSSQDVDPTWSPDGSRIAFATTEQVDGNLDVFVMNADGTNPVPVTRDAANERAPDWGTVPLPPPVVRCRVPRVIGMTLRRARSRIRARHCSVGRFSRARSARFGRVIRQSPRPGSVRRRGYPVTLVVGRR